MSGEATDPDLYVRADGFQEALWMKPHRDLADSLPLTDEQRRQVNDAFDAIYTHTIEEREEETQTQRELLGAIFRAAAVSGGEQYCGQSYPAPLQAHHSDVECL